MNKKLILFFLAIIEIAHATPASISPSDKLICYEKLFVKENKCTIIVEVKNSQELKKLSAFLDTLQIRRLNDGSRSVFTQVTQDQLMQILEQPFVIKVKVVKAY